MSNIFDRRTYLASPPRGIKGRLTAVVALLVAIWTRVVHRWQHPSNSAADDASTFTPHHRLELLPIGASEDAV